MFQKTIAQSRFTLAVSIAIAALSWFAGFLFSGHPFAGAAWPLGSVVSAGLGFLVAAIAIYFLAELNNAFVLLHISSRMLSSLLALLLAAAPMLHPLQPAHAVLLCAVLAYFPLFANYQRPTATTLTFLTFLLVGLASLAFPQLLFCVPVCWVSLVVLRAFSLRAWVASLFGVVLPYWLWLAWAYCTDSLATWLTAVQSLGRTDPPDYSQGGLQQWAVCGIAFLFFGVGMVDFLRGSHGEKTRTRFHYYVVMLHGSVAFLWVLLQPQHFHFLFPLCLVNAAILGGHFLALSFGKFQNIITIILFSLLFLTYLSQGVALD